MFTGIIEAMGEITRIDEAGTNRTFTVHSFLAPELKVDQSLSHNGVCLTVEAVTGDAYQVTAIRETLLKSNLGHLRVGDTVNLERSMLMNGRLDGHIVQGHVDQTGVCTAIDEQAGSWLFDFDYDPHTGNITVEKGSVCINGVSLTVFDSHPRTFRVAIIPYTYAHTNFRTLRVGDTVNIEFDIIGKYLARLLPAQFRITH